MPIPTRLTAWNCVVDAAASRLFATSILGLLASLSGVAQTLYTPGGTVGNSGGSNVGIGTSTPGTKLHVFGGDVTITDTGAGQVAALMFDAATGTGDIGFSNLGSLKFLLRGNTDANGGTLDLADRTAGHVSRLFIAGNGNVGIGTATPGSRLVVASPQSAPSNTIVGEFTKDGSGNGFGSAILRVSRGIGSESSDLELNSGGEGPFRYGNYADTLLVSNQAYTHGPFGSVHIVTNQAPRLTIGGGTLAGNVGVGTTTPEAAFHVFGSGKRIGLSDYALPTSGEELGMFTVKVATPATTWAGSIVSYGANGRGLRIYNNGGVGNTAFEIVQGAGSRLIINGDGNVGIGTTNPTQKLAVNGTIRAKEVIVEASPWPDDVFAPGYDLPSLDEIAAHIEAEGHLPDVPNAAAVAGEGVAVGEMQKTLLRKVEELTLYLINQEKRLGHVEVENAELKAEIARLRTELP